MADEPVNGTVKKPPWARGLVAAVVILGSFAFFALVAVGWCSLAWRDVILMIVGAVISNLTTVVNWYFGSSEDSSKKTDMLAGK